eukprot:m.37720 g.37720  ORF g.37720 m.37720 type:complete len:62 (+) comp32435_c0_seq3:20-205(+)
MVERGPCSASRVLQAQPIRPPDTGPAANVNCSAGLLATTSRRSGVARDSSNHQSRFSLVDR